MNDNFLDELINEYVNPIKKINNNKPKNPANFLITINPNISYRQLKENSELRQQTNQNIIDVNRELKNNINQYIYDEYKINNELTTINNMKSFVEIGEKKGFIHNHSYISLNNSVKLDIPKINKMINEKFNRNVYLNVKYYVDNQKMIDNYTSKGKNELKI